ncbi:MAG TPA: polysaccharide deacetylase family protein [Firmicutes bacterium]|nr:polysaccharide deacetylase family protein [Bacillota bacterium]
MTFDDGPTVAPARPYSGRGITELILEVMSHYGAKGTFDVIGSTAENYPDEAGKPGSFTWSGKKYDHYPEFGQDQLAGVANQPDLVRKILMAGHELSNHGYRHMAFGPQPIIYGSRAYFRTIEEVITDLKRLHTLVSEEFGFSMTLGRPPHYIDRIPDGHFSYDAYEALGYQYLAASFDGGGWRAATGDPADEVEKMVTPMQKALEEDPDCLNGQIIFQKDGYNMSLQAPIVEALPKQLALLKRYDYEVIPVGQLLAVSPYRDIGPSHPAYAAVRHLEAKGLPVLYPDNTFRPEQPCLVGEMLQWLPYKDTLSSFCRDQLTVGMLLRMVPEKAASFAGITTRETSRPVPRWQAALAAVESIENG